MEELVDDILKLLKECTLEEKKLIIKNVLDTYKNTKCELVP